MKLIRTLRGLGACALTAFTLAYAPVTILVVLGVVTLFFIDRRIR